MFLPLPSTKQAENSMDFIAFLPGARSFWYGKIKNEMSHIFYETVIILL